MFFITETWIHKSSPDSLFCPSIYSCIRNDRVSGRGGGVMVLYKNTVNVNHIFPRLTLDFLEFIVIDVTSNRNKRKIKFVCFYFPPNAAASLENIDKVCKILTSCINVSFPTFVLGDFNLPYIDWSVPISHGGVNHQAFVQFCITNSLNQLIAEPTHSNGNILDLLLCNYFSSNILISYCIDMPFCSSCDHSSIHFHLKCTVRTKQPNPNAIISKKPTTKLYVKC